MATNELLSQNIKRWSVFQAEVAHLLQNLEYQAVFPAKSKSGDPNLKILYGEKEAYIHSEEDPKQEALNWFEGLDLKDVSVIFVYGIGLGYYYDAAREWLRKSDSHHLVFLEDNVEVIKRLFETDRGSAILHDKQVWFYYFDAAGRSLATLAALFPMKQYLFSTLNSYQNLFSDRAGLAKAHLDYHMNTRWGFIVEYSNHGYTFNKNYLRNLLLLPEARNGQKLYGQFKGVPAIICGAGPSLAKNFSTLEHLRDRALILAGATAMNALNTYDFIPHFGIGIDPNPAQFTRLIMNQAYEVPYFYKNRFLNEALKIVHGDHLFLTGSMGHSIGKWVEEELGIAAQDLEDGFNVVNLSTALAVALGCNPIIFVGLDLAYTDMHSYAPGIINHPLHNLRENFRTKGMHEELVSKEDIFGKPILTLWKWISESAWYTEYARKHPETLFINATEGGIGFAGIPNMPLKVVSETLLKRQFDLDGMVEKAVLQANMPSQLTQESISQFFKKFSDSLNNASKYCTVIYEDFLQSGEKLKAGGEVSPSLLSDAGIEALMNLEQEVAYIQVLKVFNDMYREIHLRSFKRLDIDLDLLSEAEINERKVSLNSGRYRFLRETIKSLLSIIDRLQAQEAEEKRLIAPGETVTLPSIEEEMPKVTASKGDQLHGPSKFYYDDGKILSESLYIDGLKEGVTKTFYRDGQVRSLQRFQKGLWEGRQEFYYPSGSLKSVLHYKEGKLDGDVALYYPNGKLKRQLHFIQGKRKGFEHIWNSAGLLVIEAEFDMDRPTGIARRWFDNGNMAEEVIFSKDTVLPTYREWDENGVPKEKATAFNYDYFDQVAVQSDSLTKALGDVVEHVSSVAPLIEKTSTPGDPSLDESLKQSLFQAEKELEHMRAINKELMFETGLDPTNPDEAIWKGPEARREVEKQIDIMTKLMYDEISQIQNALAKTVGLLANKIAAQSKKTPPEEKK